MPHKKCKIHGHRPTCKPNCVKPGHVCYKRPCLKDCTGHADRTSSARRRGSAGSTTTWCSPPSTALPSNEPRTGSTGRPSSSRAGVRDVRVHDARHTAATLLIEQGVNIRVVQQVLGHTRVTTTERYTHVSTPLMRDAGERLASALWGNP
ncbi:MULTISPECIES: tyrosine-type recombinase/integrase [unclassified Nonomuraea]|uniref:tyrosine-type recombinase/integrase n=1 Tax=unclassified Nonomuraea TaxID=2593643 RepID=UPI0033E619E1